MKLINTTLLVVILVIVVNIVHGQNKKKNDESKLSHSLAQFSFDFFKALVNSNFKGTTPSNLVFSPSNVFRVLLLLNFGCQGNSRSELTKALHVTDAEDVLIKMHKDMKAKKEAGLLEADIIYYGKNMKIKRNIQTLMGEDLVGAALQDQTIVKKVNTWVSASTQGNIKQYIQSPFPKDVKMVLLSAIFMRANWETPFDQKKTKKEIFNVAESMTKMVDMMYLQGELQYLMSETLNCEVVSLKYNKSPLVFLVFLPERNSQQTVKNLASTLTPKSLQIILKSLVPTNLELYLPKLQVQNQVDLIPLLKTLGVNDVFSSEAANLTGFTDDRFLYVGEASQTVVMNVDETGTTAAAVSAIKAMTRSRKTQMKVDRPFLFMIYDTSSQSPVFMGAMMDPSMK